MQPTLSRALLGVNLALCPTYNLRSYPAGHWWGYVKPGDVPRLLSVLTVGFAEPSQRALQPASPVVGPPSGLEDIWRGRMGLARQEQEAFVGRTSAPVTAGDTVPVTQPKMKLPTSSEREVRHSEPVPVKPMSRGVPVMPPPPKRRAFGRSATEGGALRIDVLVALTAVLLTFVLLHVL